MSPGVVLLEIGKLNQFLDWGLAINLSIYQRRSAKGDNTVTSWKSKEGDHMTGDNIYQYFKYFTVF